MFYIYSALVVLVIASRLLWLQYRQEQGTPSHAKRGTAITLLALAALFFIEYALWMDIVILFKYLPFLVVHLSFAIPTFIALCVITATGIATYRTKFRAEREDREPLLRTYTHRLLVKGFPYMWAATIVTGLMFFIASVRS